MYTHAALESNFKNNNIGPDSKMIPLDDVLLQEEHKEDAIKLRKTTAQLVRAFKTPAM